MYSETVIISYAKICSEELVVKQTVFGKLLCIISTSGEGTDEN